MGLKTFLRDKFKNAPTATSPSGLSTLLVNALGELVKTGAILIQPQTQYISDLNAISRWCIMILDALSAECLNCPVRASGLVFMCFGNYQIILRAGDGGKIYFRANNSGWQSWKTVV